MGRCRMRCSRSSRTEAEPPQHLQQRPSSSWRAWSPFLATRLSNYGPKHGRAGQLEGHGHRLGVGGEIMDNIIWFLTGNAGKLAEAQHHLHPLGYEVRLLSVYGENIVEPQASDLETVARAKLEQALGHLPSPQARVLVEDAGLFVDALNGFPGVYSAYALDTLGCHGILRLLAHLSSDDPVQAKRLRSARFWAVAGLWDGEQMVIGVGDC